MISLCVFLVQHNIPGTAAHLAQKYFKTYRLECSGQIFNGHDYITFDYIYIFGI